MVIVLICICSLGLVANAAYNNEYDGPLDFRCPSSTQTISRIQSIHDNHKEDRRFDISCREFLSQPSELHPSCFQTDFLNAYDALLHYTCPTNHYINGMYSVHNSHSEDRRWKIFCCSIPDVHLLDCSSSGWTNEYDQPQDFSVPANHVLKSVHSIHNNHNEDRIFEYTYCGVEFGHGDVVGK